MGVLPVSIGIGLAVSLFFSELFGLAAGGMVVPGYIALYLHRPVDVALTIGAGFATFALVHALSAVLILYGRRRTVLMILIGYLLGMMAHQMGGALLSTAYPDHEIQVIGYIIPGLIGIWLERQGVIETMSVLLIAACVVRLVLVLVMGQELPA
ncbi:MAG: hypothetical protein GMKNLPBB_03027 [Myxococcota bacterium]|nr:hypothetical protein [Myxococcota bacterium]